MGHHVGHTGSNEGTDMAWAEKLPSGKYRGVYRDAAGTKRSAGVFTHKPRAIRAAGAREEEARRKMARDPEAYKRPWGEWCDEWWPTRTVAPSTARNDAMRRRNHLDAHWSTKPIGSITRQDVRAWAADLRKGGMGAESVKRCVHLLSASLSAAVEADVIEVNPAARMKLPGGALAQERFLTREEHAALRDAMPTTFDQLVLDMLCFTGLRWGELAGLHAHRVDLRRGTLRVVETYDETARAMNAYPKGKTLRDVPLMPEVLEPLRAMPPLVGTCGVEHVAGKCRSPLLLSTETGAPLRNSNWAARVWKPALERADLGHVRIHDCRHTAASWMLQGGMTLAEVRDVLGHKSPQTTDKYAHLAAMSADKMRAAMAAPQKPHAGTESA